MTQPDNCPPPVTRSVGLGFVLSEACKTVFEASALGTRSAWEKFHVLIPEVRCLSQRCDAKSFSWPRAIR